MVDALGRSQQRSDHRRARDWLRRIATSFERSREKPTFVFLREKNAWATLALAFGRDEADPKFGSSRSSTSELRFGETTIHSRCYILYVPKTLSGLMTPWNHLSWRNDRAILFRSGRPGLAIQVEVAA